ncbi:MAG: hypothetical protein PHC51_05825 [bacterium]|nr:hypothetical protein [bacterium]
MPTNQGRDYPLTVNCILTKRFLLRPASIQLGLELDGKNADKKLDPLEFLSTLLDFSPYLYSCLFFDPETGPDRTETNLAINFRGHHSISAAVAEKSAHEELFYCSADIPPLPPDDQPAIPCEISLYTSFQKMTTDQIISTKELNLKGAFRPLAPLLTPLNLPYLVPLEANKLRISLEFFRKEFIHHWVGNGPRFFGSFMLEVSRNKLRVLLQDNSIEQSCPSPFKDQKLIFALDATLKRIGWHHNLLKAIDDCITKHR